MWDFYLFGFLDKRVNESGRVEGKSFYSQAEIRFTEYSFRFYSTTLTKVFSEKKTHNYNHTEKDCVNTNKHVRMT